MSEFKPIETQEQLDAIITERINRAKESVKKEYDGWMSQKDFESKTADLTAKIGDHEKTINELKTKVTDYEKNMAEKDAKIKGYETDSVKTRIAHEAGLPYDAISFLQGEDEEAIKKSAETLKALVKPTAPPLADPEGKGSSEDAELKNMLNNLVI